LWGIAERYGVSESAIKAANRRSSDIVIEGETLLIPSTSGSQGSSFQAGNGTHIVRRGESLGKIAAAYRVSAAALQQANNITNPDLIQEGQALVIPGQQWRHKPPSRLQQTEDQDQEQQPLRRSHNLQAQGNGRVF